MESAANSTAAHKPGHFANGPVNSFLDSVEDLMGALKDVESPEIARVRAKVRLALAAAKSAAVDTAAQIGSGARQIGQRTDGFVRDNPWQVIGIAAVVGLAVGFLASRRS
jgi:ElaB/YqjD/DUF883 family membrane-anchored ribosome-binding protein